MAQQNPLPAARPGDAHYVRVLETATLDISRLPDHVTTILAESGCFDARGDQPGATVDEIHSPGVQPLTVGSTNPAHQPRAIGRHGDRVQPEERTSRFDVGEPTKAAAVCADQGDVQRVVASTLPDGAEGDASGSPYRPRRILAQGRGGAGSEVEHP